MTENQNIPEEPIDLDPSELLGLSQVAKVSGVRGTPDDLARLLSKIGEPPPPAAPLVARLLSKIGEGSV